MSKEARYADLFNNFVTLVSKKDQIALIDDGASEGIVKLNVLAGKSYDISFDTAKRYFELIYLDDTCFETRQRIIDKYNV